MADTQTICFEGIDGCGRNTQIMMLRDSLLPRPVRILHFPEYTEFGRKLRDVILETPDLEPLPRQILLWVDFLQTYYTHFTGDGIQILDRLPHYTCLAYGAAMGVDVDTLKKLRTLLEAFIPDITFILDIPADSGAARMKRSTKVIRRSKLRKLMEVRGHDVNFLQRVRENYLEMRSLYPQDKPIYIVDADREPEAIHQEVYRIVEEHAFV